MTISRVKFPWPPFFRIFIFFDEIFISVCGTTYLMRDDGATVVNVRPLRVGPRLDDSRLFTFERYRHFRAVLSPPRLPQPGTKSI